MSATRTSDETVHASPWDPRRWVADARRFFGEEIWRANVKDLARSKGLLYRTARVVYGTVRGFREDRLPFRSAALTYYTILSVVPFLAFAFSVLKGLGAYDTFLRDVVAPYVQSNFAQNPALLRAIDQVLQFVTNTNVSGLGITGLVFLTYTSISLLATVESVFNQLWGFRQGRTFFRRVTDYVTLVVVTPILALVAVTFGAAAQSSDFVMFARENLSLGPLIDVALRLTSIVGICGAMTAMLVIMPNGKVRPLAAVIGGVVGGLLWQLALILHVDLQMGVARYNALYSGFGALPIFLVWVYVSWLVVLLAAELASSYQNEQVTRQRLRARDVDQALEEAVALGLIAAASRAYLGQARRPSVETLSGSFGAPPQTISSVAHSMVAGGLLATSSSEDGEVTYLPARDIDRTRVSDVLAVLRHRTHPIDAPPAIEIEVPPSIKRVLRQMGESAAMAEANVTVRELVAEMEREREREEKREEG